MEAEWWFIQAGRLAAGRRVVHVSTLLSTCMNKAPLLLHPLTHRYTAAAWSDSESSKPSYNLAAVFLVDIQCFSLCTTHSMQNQRRRSLPDSTRLVCLLFVCFTPCSSSSAYQSKYTTKGINTRWTKRSNLILGLKRDVWMRGWSIFF